MHCVCEPLKRYILSSFLLDVTLVSRKKLIEINYLCIYIFTYFSRSLIIVMQISSLENNVSRKSPDNLARQNSVEATCTASENSIKLNKFEKSVDVHTIRRAQELYE